MAHTQYRSFGQVVALVQARAAAGQRIYVRYSHGPRADRAGRSRDHASGRLEAGLSAVELQLRPGWEPAESVAQDLLEYAFLLRADPGRRAWIVIGTEVDRGADNEPVIKVVEWLGWVAEPALDQAVAVRDNSQRRQAEQWVADMMRIRGQSREQVLARAPFRIRDALGLVGWARA